MRERAKRQQSNEARSRSLDLTAARHNYAPSSCSVAHDVARLSRASTDFYLISRSPSPALPPLAPRLRALSFCFSSFRASRAHHRTFVSLTGRRISCRPSSILHHRSAFLGALRLFWCRSAPVPTKAHGSIHPSILNERPTDHLVVVSPRSPD